MSRKNRRASAKAPPILCNVLLALLLPTSGSVLASVPVDGLPRLTPRHSWPDAVTDPLNSNQTIDCSNKPLSLRAGSCDSSYCEDAVAKMWKRHLTWKKVSEQQWGKIRRNRLAVLKLTVAGAALQTAAKQLPPKFGWIASLAGGGCAALVPYISSKYLGSNHMDIWKRSNAASKAIEAEIFLFRAGVAPYSAHDGSNPVDRLVNFCSNVSNDMKDLYGMYAMVEDQTKTQQFSLAEPPPPLVGRTGYLNARVNVETEMYKKKALFNAKRAELLQSCHSAAALLSGAIGLIAGGAGDGIVAQLPQIVGNFFKSKISPWGAVASTASAAIAAHIMSANHDELASTFLGRAKHLENLEFRLDSNVEPESAEWAKFVTECEEIIAGDIHKWDVAQTR